MSETATEVQPTPDEQPSELQSGESDQQATSEPAPDPLAARLDGESVPVWARGRTVQEVLAQAENLNQTLQQYATSDRAPAQPQAPPESHQGDEPNAFSINVDDLYANPENFTRSILSEAERRASQAVQSASGPILQPLSRVARSEAAQAKREIFDRYGAEIDSMMASIPLQQKVSADAWLTAADVVAGRHWKELAEAQMERTLASRRDPGSMPTQSNPTSGSPARNAIDKLFKDKHPAVQRYVDNEVDAATLVAHAKRMGKTPEEYAESLKKIHERASA